jgi:hypothetical protein
MRSCKVLVPLFLLCTIAFASESRLPFGTVFKGQDQFNRLVAKAKAGNWKALPIGERTAAVGQALVRTRYKHFTLEIDNRIESPSVNFQGMDCWTFFEIALSFARMLNEPESNWTPERLLHPFRARDECWLATLSLSGCKPLAARATRPHGSKRFIPASLRNSKKPGRSD